MTICVLSGAINLIFNEILKISLLLWSDQDVSLNNQTASATVHGLSRNTAMYLSTCKIINHPLKGLKIGKVIVTIRTKKKKKLTVETT